MTLILRKCWKSGYSSNGFYYGQVGERVNCPDWNPEPKCGNGLHGLKEGNGNWELLIGDDWLVIDADDQVVDIDEHKCKFNTGIIEFRGNFRKLRNSKFPSVLKLDSKNAFNWALDIGNKDIMIDRITDSKNAFYWALNIGNQDIMIDRIIDSKYAYEWALNIGNQDTMIDRIIDSQYAYYWALNIGNHDVMINRIADSEYAYYWALNIGNHDIMIDRITDSQYAYYWALNIGNHDIMKSRVTEEFWINE